MIIDIPEATYNELRSSIPEDLYPKILSVLKLHIGKANRITRRELDEAVWNLDFSGVDLNNSTLDRQVREVLVKLQEDYPILSTSGGGGYYYAGSADEISRYAAELDSRAKKLLGKSRKLLKMATRFQKEVQLQLMM
jgi:hypothetical protein